MSWGFIHDKLDMKLLILYIMDRAAGPISFDTLTDLAMCDDGVDYFQFAEAVSELLESGHLSQDEENYAVTDKGRQACAAGESSLSPVIRRRCDQRLAPLNQVLKRNAQVRAELRPHSGGVDICLTLDDDAGRLFSLTLLAPSQSDAQQIAEQFRRHPDTVYNAVLKALLPDHDRSENQ